MPKKPAANHAPPDWLGVKAREKWAELLPRLKDVTAEDADTLAVLCSSWESYLNAQADVVKNGQTLAGDKGRRFINPAVNIVTEERKSIIKIGKLLGLTPDAKSARGAGKSKDDKFEALIDK